MAERLRVLLRGEKGVRLAVVLGIAGILLLLLPWHTGDAAQPEPEPPPQSAEDYCTALEKRLAGMLARVEGVGEVTVMVTVRGSGEQVYAEEVKTAQNEHGTQRESSYRTTRSGGNESALLAETKLPAVAGVAVVCTGGGHPAVQERVTKAVSTVLGISPAQIYVGKSET